jgi:hypothetical protein
MRRCVNIAGSALMNKREWSSVCCRLTAVARDVTDSPLEVENFADQIVGFHPNQVQLVHDFCREMKRWLAAHIPPDAEDADPPAEPESLVSSIRKHRVRSGDGPYSDDCYCSIGHDHY